MFKMRSANRRSFNLRFLPAICLLFAAGCGDSQIKTYRVAKDDNAPKVAAHTHAAEEGGPPPMAEHSSAPLPKVSWTLPKGWKELPSQGGVRKASFGVEGPNGKMAQVAVIPLTVPSNIELESVNMWREELGLNPLTREEVATQAKPTEVGDAKGNLFEMVSEKSKPGTVDKTRTLGAITERDGAMWFVKMTGSDDLVAEQKPIFVGFLKSLKFEAPSPTELAAAERPASTNAKTVPAASDGPRFQIPANWQQKAPGAMVTAAYTVSGPEGQGDISVSKFPGDVGGLAPNVNRWRGQLGLPELSDAEARNSVEMVEIDGKKNAYLVDFKGTNARTGKQARMVALGVPRGGETWFYKLIGDEALVAKEKDTFLKFVVSAY
jgi:hypothetical protein